MTGPLRLEYIDAASLSENPANWRRHPENQARALSAAIAECGWVKPCIYNELTGRLIDGHLRRKLAVGSGPIPVVIGSWDEATERKILATLDNTGLLAETDATAWAQLLKGGNGHDPLNTASQDLADLLGAVSESVGLLDTDGSTHAPEDGAANADPDDESETASTDPASGVPDALWPSDNDWGVPTLDPRLQADAVDSPCVAWGSSGARSKPLRGTVCFYTHDRFFEALWSNPGPVLRSGCPTVVEPNFSTHEQMPAAFALWGIYRKRWLARYWQSKGLRVFVDLNVHPNFRRLNLLGVPRSWRAFATRSHSEGAALDDEFGLAAEHAGTDQLLFLVYGGGSRVKQLAGERGWVWVPEQSDVVRNKGPK